MSKQNSYIIMSSILLIWYFLLHFILIIEDLIYIYINYNIYLKYYYI